MCGRKRLVKIRKGHVSFHVISFLCHTLPFRNQGSCDILQDMYDNWKGRMRQTAHLTCLAVRGLLNIRKGRILFHFMSFPSFGRWSHSVRACTRSVHAQIPSLNSAKIDSFHHTIFARNAPPKTIMSCVDCKN